MQFAPEIIIKLTMAFGLFMYLAPGTTAINRSENQNAAKSDAINNPH